MILPTSEPVPDEETDLKPARRRRERRALIPHSGNEQAEILADLALRMTPTFEFFLFSLLAGVILAAGVLLDSQTLLVLGAVVAPFMGPLMGLSLAAVSGSGRFFVRVLLGTGVGGLLVFATGALAGLAAPLWPGLPYFQVQLQPLFSWVSLAVLGFGILFSVISLVRSGQKPVLASVLIAYALYTPLVSAGLGLATGSYQLLGEGLGVFVVYLAAAVLLGILVFVIRGFRPLTPSGYILAVAVLLVSVGIVISVSGIKPEAATQAPTPLAGVEEASATATVTITIPFTATQETPLQPSDTPTPPQASRTPTRTLVPSATSTITLTPAPTPLWAIVNAENGVYVRAHPSSTSDIVAGVNKGGLVKVLPETAKEGLTTWVHIITPKGVEGWVIQSVLVTATPAPGW